MSGHIAAALLVMALVAVFMTSVYVTAQQPVIATCVLSAETATGNSRSEVAYYECLPESGAVVPSVTFVVHADTPGHLWLRQLAGRTVDVQLVTVR